MDFQTYQAYATETAVYPEAGRGTLLSIAYTALGASGEAGEIANKVKKYLRGDEPLTYTKRVEIRQEIGGVLWYLSQLSRELGFDLSEAADENIAILASRQKRGVIKGSGDNR
jgi:NTP pyrophosphatase (non-canonical NTP hydrolase)